MSYGIDRPIVRHGFFDLGFVDPAVWSLEFLRADDVVIVVKHRQLEAAGASVYYKYTHRARGSVRPDPVMDLGDVVPLGFGVRPRPHPLVGHPLAQRGRV